MEIEAAREASEEAEEFLDRYDIFEDATAIGAINVIITNTTDIELAAFLTRGVVVIGNEQVDLSDYEYLTDLTGAIFPGVTKNGTITFALYDSNWGEISDGVEMYFNGDTPHDDGNYGIGDTEYEFKFSLVVGQTKFDG